MACPFSIEVNRTCVDGSTPCFADEDLIKSIVLVFSSTLVVELSFRDIGNGTCCFGK